MDNDTLRRLEKGREHYENKEYDKAETYLLKVAEVEDRFADVMNMLGVIYHNKGEVAVAQQFFEKAIRINPRYTEAALNLAVTCNEQGLYKQANQIYNQLTSQLSDSQEDIEPFARGKLANMHAELGHAYAELQRHDRAISQYREALALCPDFVDIRTRLGQLLKDTGALDEALAEFKKVKEIRPNYIPAKVSLGVTYFAKGDKPAARREWKEVLEIDPQNKTADMYVKMVEQLLALQEAVNSGLSLEIGDLEKTKAGESIEPDTIGSGAEDDLSFTFEGEQPSVPPTETQASDVQQSGRARDREKESEKKGEKASEDKP